MGTDPVKPSLRNVVPYERLCDILAFPYARRMRYLRMLRYLLPMSNPPPTMKR